MDFSSYDDVVNFHNIYRGRGQDGLLTMRYPKVADAYVLVSWRDDVEKLQAAAGHVVLLSMGHIDQLCLPNKEWGPAISHESGRILDKEELRQETLQDHLYAGGPGAEFLLVVTPDVNMASVEQYAASLRRKKDVPPMRIVVSALQDSFAPEPPGPV